MLLHPEVIQQLEQEGFGVYHSLSAAKPAVIPAVAVAAVFVIALAGWCFRALR
jgi:hypothetical protein